MNRAVLYLVIYLIFLHSVGFAQSALLTEGEVSAKNFRTEVEFEMFRGHIIIPAIINGKTYRFLFDTGAPNMFVEDIFSDPELQTIKLVDGNQASDQVGIGLIDRIRLGGIDFEGYGALKFNFNERFPFRCYGIAGIIGSNLFRDLVVKIDYAAKKLIITDHIRTLAPTTRPVKMTLHGKQLRPLLHLKLGPEGRRKEKVSFDSGSNGFYGIALEAFEDAERSDSVYTDVIKMTGKGSVGLFGVGVPTVQYFTTISNFSMGSVDFKGVTGVTSNADFSTIGTKILQYGNVILDFRKKRFYFEPTNQYVADPSNRPKYIGSVKDERYVIGFIVDPKLKEKVSVGDRIVEIDGVDITKLDPCAMFMIPSKAKESIVVQSSNGRLTKILM